MNTDASIVLSLEKLGLTVKLNEDMSCHTTFKAGGRAEYFISAKNPESIYGAIKLAEKENIDYFILGKGSDTLFRDSGFNGFVISTAQFMTEIKVSGNIIKAQAGASLAHLCMTACENSLTGLEFAYGIPGSVGGAVFMNAGAYGGEMKDIIKSVTYLDKDGRIITKNRGSLDLSYRHSFFSDNPGCVIISCEVELKKGVQSEIKSKMDDLTERRRSKQPLEYPSAGSAFKRPEGYFASKLIDDCGLRGVSVGNAQISEKHTGFIINKGGATADDIIGLIKLAQKTVFEKTGVRLEPEIRIIPA